MDDFSRWTVWNDPFDVMSFERHFKDSKILRETLDPKKLATSKELGQDVYDALFKFVPKMREEAEIDPAYGFNKALVEKAMGTQEYARLRNVTRLQETESALATEIITKQLLEEMSPEDREAVNDYQQVSQNLQRSLQQMQALSQMTKLPPKLQKLQKQLQQQVPQLQAQLAKAQQALNQAMQNPNLRAAVRAALGQAHQQLNAIQEFAGGWGLDPGQLQKVPAKDRMEIMKRIVRSPKIRELTKLMGRFKRLAFQKRYTRITTEPSEVTDIRRGTDLARVLPTEFASLTIPEREDEFYQKLVEGKLLQYEMKGRETYGRGPIIICIDNSGSMGMGAEGVTREMWAKAMALAMAEIALRDKRDIEFINFGSYNEVQKTVVSWKLPPEERLRLLIDVAETNFGGGTDFERPLGESMKDIDRQEFKKADVIMVTDGECDVSEKFEKKFREVKEKKQFRLHSVIIGGTAESLERFSDTVHHLWDLVGEGDTVAGDLFEAV